jgi:putative ABC transport system substrate-binding protein
MSGGTMRRREFITVLGGVATARPLAANAQPLMPVVGYLEPGSLEAGSHLLAAFRKGLSEVGYVEGRNVAIEFRFADNDYNRLPELVTDLLGRRVAILAIPFSPRSVLAAKSLTTTIPIVFNGGFDPVEAGLVASFNRPGGNVTGISSMNQELGGKRLGLLQALLPGATRFAALFNPNTPTVEPQVKEVQTAAAAIGRQVDIIYASTNREIDATFAGLVQKRTDALVVAPNTLFSNRRQQLSTLAARHAIPRFTLLAKMSMLVD